MLTGSSQQVVGAIGVAKEKGVPWIGVQADQSSANPEIVMASAIYDWKQLLKDILAKSEAGTLGGEVLQLTYANGGIKTNILLTNCPPKQSKLPKPPKSDWQMGRSRLWWKQE